ncbi:MAG: hypothetical protein JST39_15715 [Bacteroidetes bacterium]|nr:hypothetical protein [Bacteroidota bacterium]
MKHHTSLPVVLLLLAAAVVSITSCRPHEPAMPVCRLDGLGKHIIPDSTAAKYQNRFLASYALLHKLAPDTFLAHHFRIPNAETFSKDALCALINYPGVDSVRIFYGEDTTGGFRLIIKGVDAKGNLVVTHYPRTGVSDNTKSTTKKPGDDGDGDALENGQTCPPCMVNLGPGK